MAKSVALKLILTNYGLMRRKRPPPRTPYFNLEDWRIRMAPVNYTDLCTNAVSQARFVHEYIHYIQVLISTMGRDILTKSLSITMDLALARCNRSRVSRLEGLPLINVLQVLRQTPTGTSNGPVFNQRYGELQFRSIGDIAFSSLKHFAKIDINRPFTGPNRSDLNETKNDAVYLQGKGYGRAIEVRFTEEVLLENMARQIQRLYLRKNNMGDTSPVDDYRVNYPEEFYYTCLHDLIYSRLPGNPTPADPSAWTIALCQYAILCKEPIAVFVKLMTELREFTGSDLLMFLRSFRYDDYFNDQFATDTLQRDIDNIISDFGKYSIQKNQDDIRDLLIHIRDVYNKLQREYDLFFKPELTWPEILGWVRDYQCSRILFSDGPRNEVCGVSIPCPWQPYLGETHRLLSRRSAW